MASSPTGTVPGQRDLSDIERLLKVNQDLQQQIAAKAQARDVPWSWSPERPNRGSRCQAALAALEPVTLPEFRYSEASELGRPSFMAQSSGSSNLPDMNRWEAYGSLVAEKEALVSKLKAEEMLQVEAIRLATEAEAQLARVAAELDALQRIQGSDSASGEMLEAKLRQQVQAVRSDCDARQGRVEDYDDSLQRSNSALASLRTDREMAISEHGQLREKALSAREQLESRIQSLRSARAVLAEGHVLGTRSPHQNERLGCARAALSELEEERRQKENEVASTKQVLQDLQKVAAEQHSAVQRIKVTNQELVENSTRGADASRSQAVRAASLVEERQREKHRLSTSVQQSEKQLSDVQAAMALQRQRDSEALAAEQRRQVEELQEAEATLWALRSRLEDASIELQGEQEQNLELRQEVMALQAAREHIFKRWATPNMDSMATKANGDEAGATQRPIRGPRGLPAWAKSHQQRLELELEELRKWKVEAAGAVQRMALGLRDLRDRYDQEVKIGQDLQETWHRVGERAENVFGTHISTAVDRAEGLLRAGEGVDLWRPQAPQQSPKVKAMRKVRSEGGWWNSRSQGSSEASREAFKAKSSKSGTPKRPSAAVGHRVRATLLTH